MAVKPITTTDLVLKLDPHGDVLIVLPSISTKLLVSSRVLSVASPVFAVMFSPTFREGASLCASTGPVEVVLADDPPEAVATVCKVLHFRHGLVREDLSDDEVYDLAVVADKYDVGLALGPWRKIWLKGDGRGKVGTDRAGAGDRELFARYTFKDVEGLRESCRKLVLEGSGCGLCDGLPDSLTAAMSQARISFIQSLLDVAEHYRLLYLSPRVKCKARAPAVASPLRQFPPVAAPTTTSAATAAARQRSMGLVCDAAVLGSLVRHYSSLGILPLPEPPFHGLSVAGLASGLKGVKYHVDVDTGHRNCVIGDEMRREVDEVLDRAKLWQYERKVR